MYIDLLIIQLCLLLLAICATDEEITSKLQYKP